MVEDLRLDSLEGVGPVTTRKMSDAGIHNIMDLLVRGPVEIAEITGMEKDTAAKIVNKARQHLVEEGLLSNDFVSASEIYKRRQSIGKISTGTNCLDTLFDGGISDVNLAIVQSIAKQILDFHDLRKKLEEHVESEMISIAPNLSAILGSAVGARLLGRAGRAGSLKKNGINACKYDSSFGS